MKRLQSFCYILIFLCSLLTVGAEGAVLCIESDGQIVLENACDRLCEKTGPSASNQISIRSTFSNNKTGNCDSCIDIPLLTNRELQTVIRTEKVELPSLILAECLSITNLIDSCVSLLEIKANTTPSESLAQTQLRSTVLRF